jgi:DNA-binding response OmpR family regulator
MTVDVAKKGLSGCRVLIVEDRYLVADDLSRMLTRNGAEIVAVAGDVGRASELAATGELDLSVLDVDLRGQDVFVVAAILEGRGIPFLFVTGFPRAHLPEKYQAFPIVAKPFSEAEVLAGIAGLRRATERPGETDRAGSHGR